MKLETFIKQCLKNQEFRKYWEEDIKDIEMSNTNECLNIKGDLTIEEALGILETSSLETIITNRGVKANVTLSTEIEFFELDDGTCPVANFLQEIRDQKLKEKTLLDIVKLSNQGRFAKRPLSVYVDDGIYELRTQQGSNLTRIFYFFVFGNKIILTNGYIKKSQKLDASEFEKAKKYRNEYSRRKQPKN